MQLDIRNLMRVSVDLKILKKILLQPNQRFLFKKQAARTVLLDESSPVLSVGTDDADYNDRSAIEMNSSILLKKRFESEMDRKLALGVLTKDYSLGVD